MKTQNCQTIISQGLYKYFVSMSAGAHFWVSASIDLPHWPSVLPWKYCHGRWMENIMPVKEICALIAGMTTRDSIPFSVTRKSSF